MSRKSHRAALAVAIHALAILGLNIQSASAIQYVQTAKILPTPVSFNPPILNGVGTDIAISGNTVAVGESYVGPVGTRNQIVRVLERIAPGVWQPAPNLTIDSGPTVKGPVRVDVDGNVLVAGGSNIFRVFAESVPGNWSATAQFNAAPTNADSLALSGNRAIYGTGEVGATKSAAHIVQQDMMGQWNETAVLHPQPQNLPVGFASSVDISGNTAIAGAPGDVGSAYLFRDSGNGAWSQLAKLTPNAAVATDDVFGSSVAISGSAAIVGAPFDNQFNPKQGAAYLFREVSPGVWSQVAKLGATDPFFTTEFGFSVAIDGDYAVVGALSALDPNVPATPGAAYVFHNGGGDMWTQIAKLMPDDGANGDWFGHRVAISGTTVVVGALNHVNSGDAQNALGAVYIFEAVPEPASTTLLSLGAILASIKHRGAIELPH